MLGFDFSIPTLAGRRRVSGFTPASLSGLIAWYDPSDLTTLFQDFAMTVPVTTDGQAVAAIADKSGNGRHARQVTAGFRPVYNTDGQQRWLSFDGANDVLAVASPIPVTGTSIYAGVSAAFDLVAPSGSGGVMSDASFRNGGAMLGWSSGSPAVITNSTTVEASRLSSMATGPLRRTVISVFTGTGSNAYFTSTGYNPYPTGVYSTPSIALRLGQGTQGGRTGYFDGRFYGAVYTQAVEADCDPINGYLTEKSGLSY